MNDVRRLPFDQYQRYRLVADLFRGASGAGRPLHVLDVGGGTGLLRRFLPEARVTLVDVVPGGAEGDLVLGDGARLPLRPKSVDLVCAFDTLEHVPPHRREAFLAECLRVARRWVCLAGPYHTPEVRAGEEALDAFLRGTLACEHRFLGEHLSHGLPDRAAVEAALAAGGAEVASVGHGNLGLWQTLMRLEMAFDEPALLPLGRSLFELYARFLHARDAEEPVYRHAVVAALDGSPLPDRAAPFAGAERDAGRAAAVVRVLEEALDLVASDADRRAWLAERAEFQRAVATLEVDLTGHREVLADREARLAEHERVQALLEERVRQLYARTPTGLLKRIKRFLSGER